MIARAKRLDLPIALTVLASSACCVRPAPSTPTSPASVAWTYRVESDARTLTIQAHFPAGSGVELVVDPEAGPFVRDLVVDGAPSSSISPNDPDAFRADACVDGCEVRYRFALADAADALGNADVGARYGASIVTTPSGFLLRPSLASVATRYRFDVVTTDGTSFVTGLRRDASGWYAADANALREAPFSAFGSLDVRTLVFGGARIDVAVPRESIARNAIDAWTRASAEVVTSYYHHFPTPEVLVFVAPVDGDEIGFAQATGGGGATILARIGIHTTSESFADDWVLPHEMTHLGMPYVPRRFHWWVEGVATYVEPVARARLGRISRARMWRGFVDGLPKGLPGAGDRGLDETPTWGRTYWGGALFCLLADVEIRKRTNGTRSIDDALRAIVDAGGDISVGWAPEKIFDVGDAATGTDVLRSLHTRMGNAPVDVDLDALWRELGIDPTKDDVVFHDDAPSAAIRRAIEGTKP